MALFLTSLTFDGLAAWLARHHARGPVALVVNASRELDDGEAIIAMAEAMLSAQGIEHRRTDLVTGAATFERAAAIVMTGGNPFRLLADLRASGTDRWLIDAHRRGLPIAGQSAGAIVCGPDMNPIRITSPFTAPEGPDLQGLSLTETLTLPHQDRPGRAALHREAAVRFAGQVPMSALWDDEVMHFEAEGTWRIVRGRQSTRIARPDDADAVAEVFHEAALAAWSSFLGKDRLASTDRDAGVWATRVAQGGRRFLVTEDDQGIAGFVWYHQAALSDAEAPIGEVDMLYTHPRAWGTGIGRRLLDRATWNLLSEGFREAILWTEARNTRALTLYRAAGWVPDGAVDRRTYLGAPIRNLRHRLDLTRHAGGN